jgi:tyrosine-protein phosphatase YwqE
MVLLHYHVVPGLDDGIRSRPEAIALDGGQATCGDPDVVAIEATLADAAGTPAAVESVRAA